MFVILNSLTCFSVMEWRPPLGLDLNPGDFLTSEKLEKTGSLDIETASASVNYLNLTATNIDPTNLFSDLCKFIGCDAWFWVILLLHYNKG